MKRLLYLVTLMLLFSCEDDNSIKSGDIVFRGVSDSNLSKAINEVTQTQRSTSYTHMGICSVEDDAVYVFHSDLGKGVVKEPLESFIFNNDTVSYNIDLYRIKKITSKQINKAISLAEHLIGEPYNTTYILEDEGYYCSEFIYELFKEETVFNLEPMTFKNPETNMFHDGWVTHYKDLGIAIPEGKLGCNPNGMAESSELVFVKKIN